jgi:hypothetical protein
VVLGFRFKNLDADFIWLSKFLFIIRNSSAENFSANRTARYKNFYWANFNFSFKFTLVPTIFFKFLVFHFLFLPIHENVFVIVFAMALQE